MSQCSTKHELQKKLWKKKKKKKKKGIKVAKNFNSLTPEESSSFILLNVSCLLASPTFLYMYILIYFTKAQWLQPYFPISLFFKG